MASLSLAVFVGSAAAQQTGTIEGRVSNQGTGAYLEGAQLRLEPLGRVALTSRDGTFQFSGIPAGTYQLQVSFTGLDTQELPVTVGPGETSRHDINLSSAVYNLEEFVVAGEREGSALALQLQRHAPNVKNVLSMDALGNVADQNLGNFLIRVPGVTTGFVVEGEIFYVQVRGVAADFNAVTVDGTRAPSGGTHAGMGRAFEIDKLPSDFIETIEVTKAPTPDMDADSIGGAVNLKTKSAFDRRGRTITYRVGGSYNVDRGTYRPQGNFMYSDLLGKDERIGVMLTTSYNRTHKPRESSNLEFERTTDTDRPLYFWMSNYGEDQLKHTRAGVGLRVDYKLSEDTTVYFNSMYSYYRDGLHRRRPAFSGITHGRIVSKVDAKGIPRDSRNRPAQIMPGWTETETETVNHIFRYLQLTRDRSVISYNHQLGGETDFGTAKLDYNINFAPSEGQDDRVIFNQDVKGVGFRHSRDVDHRWAIGRYEQTSGPDIRDPANRTLPLLTFINGDIKRDQIWGAQANLRKELDLPVPTHIKLGMRMREQKREHERHREYYQYVGPDGVIGLNPATGTNDDNLARFMDEGYDHEPLKGFYPNVPFFHVPTLLEDFRTNRENYREDPVRTLRESLQNDRSADESVFAAYLLGSTQLNRLGVLGGLRVEQTQVNAFGPIRVVTPEEMQRRLAWPQDVPLTEEELIRRTQAEYGNSRSVSGEYRNVFPSLHLKYEALDGLLARASWSTGIGRPSFNSVIPSDNVNHEDELVTTSNPNLRPQYADNFDFSLEYYFEPAGMISAGVFLKEIRDFIFTADAGLIPEGPDNGFEGSYGGYTLRSPQNGGSARVRGVEIAYQQQFSHLPGFWRGFGIYSNFTWLEAMGDYGNIGQSRTEAELKDFVPRTGNLGISYIDHGWTIRVQMNYTGEQMVTYNSNPSRRQWLFSKAPLDVSVRYDFSPKLSVYADVINVFNEPLQRAYVFDPSRERRNDQYTPVVKFGVSGRF